MTSTLLTVVVAGIVEGVTEFLPVSSTGHLLLTQAWMHRHLSDVFNIVIQSGAVLAVLPLFHDRLSQFVFRWRARDTLLYMAKIVLAFGITGIGGLILEKGGFKLPERLLPVALALFIGGVAFVVIEAWLKGRPRTSDVSWTIAAAVGGAQLLAAVFPGTSRSGATILFALLLGMGRPAATEFSFLVGIPTMLAAGGLKIVQTLHHPVAGAPREDWTMVGLGFAISAIVSFGVVKWLLTYVRTHTFTVFGWYRIALAILIFVLLAFGWQGG